MKPAIAAALILLAPALAAADDPPKADKPAGDLAKVQGSWKTMAGPNMDVPIVMTIDGDSAQIRIAPADGRAMTIRGKLKLDESAEPKAWDFVDGTGPDGQDLPPMPAIYKIEGDKLTLCSGEPEGGRPTEFKAGTGRFPSLRVYDRVEEGDAPKPANAPADAIPGDLGKVQGKWSAMIGPDKNIPIVIEVKGKAITLSLTTPEGQEFDIDGEVALDESTKPGRWDWVNFKGIDGEAVPDNLGLYKLDGDELTIVSGGPGNPRPAEFVEGQGGPPNLVVLKRVTK